MLLFKSCPRCRGDIHLDKDSYGLYAKCLQCGFSRDLPPKALDRRIAPKAAPPAVEMPDEAAA